MFIADVAMHTSLQNELRLSAENIDYRPNEALQLPNLQFHIASTDLEQQLINLEYNSTVNMVLIGRFRSLKWSLIVNICIVLIEILSIERLVSCYDLYRSFRVNCKGAVRWFT